VETLVQQLSNPAVAFASAPLNENDYPLPLPAQETPEPNEEEASDEEVGDPNQMMESYYFVPEPKGFYHSVQKKNEQRYLFFIADILILERLMPFFPK
jgi:hypothetical protein